MNLNKNIPTSVGLTIVLVLSVVLIGLIIYSWDWASNFQSGILSNIN